jgi:hypothetical protein
MGLRRHRRRIGTSGRDFRSAHSCTNDHLHVTYLRPHCNELSAFAHA